MRSIRWLLLAQALLCFVLGAMSYTACGSKAQAYNGPSHQWSGYQDVLARVLIAEADGSRGDWAAISWTLEHRRERFDESPDRIMRYSTTLRSGAKRPREVHALTESLATGARARQYRDALAFVASWVRGNVPDPCPDAIHWYGIGDSRPDWFADVSCGVTRNTFGKNRVRAR